jgi:hypothetical protein
MTIFNFYLSITAKGLHTTIIIPVGFIELCKDCCGVHGANGKECKLIKILAVASINLMPELACLIYILKSVVIVPLGSFGGANVTREWSRNWGSQSECSGLTHTWHL